MKNKTLAILLISVFLGGCSMLSPFKSINSCSDAKNNGAPCASVESNLEYSIDKDNPETVPASIPEAEKDKNKKKTIEEAAASISPPHDESDVMKDEIVRLMAEMSIDTNVTKRPTLIPSSTYRVLVFPYAVGERFYSARYVYITAGKPRWITGNYILSDGEPFKVDTPAAPAKKTGDVISGINLKGGNYSEKKETDKLPAGDTANDVKSGGNTYEKSSNQPLSEGYSEEMKPDITVINPQKPVKHRVNAYLLNCRDMPGMEGNSIAVFEQDRVLDIVDKSLDWWKVSFYDMSCYVNPKYLYAEPVE